MRRLSALASALSVLLLGTVAATAGASIRLLPVQVDLSSMHVMTLGTSSFEKGPFQGQIPFDDAAVESLEVSLSNDIELGCDQVPLEQALVALDSQPDVNGESTDGGEGDCLFVATLKLKAGAETYELASTCFAWEQNESSCWIEGDVGAFVIRRDSPAARAFDLIFDGTRPEVEGGNGDGAGGDWPTNAMLIETLPPYSEDPKEAVWLVWPESIITLSFRR